MKVQLLTHIEKLGKEGDVVDVSPGYAKNALFLKKKARPATPQMITSFEKKKKEEKEKHDTKAKKIQEIKKQIEKEVFTFSLRGGEGGELFTSLHSQDVAERITSYVTSIDPLFGEKDVHVDIKPIKQVGKHTIPARLGKEDYITNVSLTLTIDGEV